ncbi:unnamed protein product [Linum tenue]|uniref:Secreted protein n=1 Tax=Linum tenue TaxID=586396 RepID=A0AAV0MH58_9ROSI|nr:unnamed protein product [Linum tenue]
MGRTLAAVSCGSCMIGIRILVTHGDLPSCRTHIVRWAEWSLVMDQQAVVCMGTWLVVSFSFNCWLGRGYQAFHLFPVSTMCITSLLD